MKKKTIIFTFLIMILCMTSTVFGAAKNTTTTSITSIKEKAEGKVYVVWSKKSVDGYQVRWSLKSDMSNPKSASTTRTYLNRSCLIGGKTYYFQVRTYKLNNGKKSYSGWSAKKSLKLKKLPPATTITSVTNKAGTGFKVKIKKLSNVQGYQIRYSTDSSFKTKKTASSVNSLISRSKLAEGKYYVAVRTYNTAADGTKYYSAWSASEPVMVETSITLDSVAVDLDKDESFALTATVIGPSQEVTWTTSDPSVATVSSDGVVKGIKAGNVIIKAQANGKTASCTVQVTDGFDLKDYVGRNYRLLLEKLPEMIHWTKAQDPAGKGNIYLIRGDVGDFFFRHDLNTGNIYHLQNGGNMPDLTLYGVKIGMTAETAKTKLVSEGWTFNNTSQSSWGYWMEFKKGSNEIRVAVTNGKVSSYQWL